MYFHIFHHNIRIILYICDTSREILYRKNEMSNTNSCLLELRQRLFAVITVIPVMVVTVTTGLVPFFPLSTQQTTGNYYQVL